MRGEKEHEFRHPAVRLGSPPHARGKGGKVLNERDTDGITPACAGKRLRKPLINQIIHSSSGRISINLEYTACVR